MSNGRPQESFTIAQLSDLHCGGPYFVPNLLERAISEVNDIEPDVVICSGDLTTFGFKEEYAQAKSYLDRIKCEQFVVIPGNHDSRNVGYVHFEELFGERSGVLRKGGVTVVSVDSTEPDLDHGQIGRGRYPWIEREFAAQPADLRVFVLHHHLLPVPGTGRERNVVYDAGDVIECLLRAGVQLVLSGHKHVPYAWRLENLFVVNTGTVSSLRLRGNSRPCYNVIEITGSHVDIWRRHPFHGQERIIQFSTDTFEYEKYTGRIEKLRGGEEYGAPLAASLEEAIRDYAPDVVLDLSDEPVLGPPARFRLAARALALGVPYEGADFRLEPPRFEPIGTPSVAVIGTGKRVGKTAVTGHVARVMARERRVVVVAMGRGGPAEPEVIEV